MCFGGPLGVFFVDVSGGLRRVRVGRVDSGVVGGIARG
ncbi:hypothetical protein B005_4641 [Nocardiopsis alba ATCC BAA-2165]|uniref:Uncharacterized protein n=1 Tax=Nocardiopsis alba (strain ATCC BAA-2165 / BE74) TaxID=1205910 RepID=J7LDH2_NOCAA|nr:hypothetical protein B005_4641 [Nocardiopsis alba ATCC BAA-2165]